MTTEHLPLWTDWVRWFAELALFVATGLLALYTAGVFRETRRMASETGRVISEALRDREIAERHHRESLVPVVTFVGECTYVAPNDRKDGINKGQLVYSGFFQNVGVGPALNVSATLTTTYITWTYSLPALHQGVGFEHALLANIDHNPNVKMPSFVPCGLQLTYSDVFNQAVTTQHVNAGTDRYNTTTQFVRPVQNLAGTAGQAAGAAR